MLRSLLIAALVLVSVACAWGTPMLTLVGSGNSYTVLAEGLEGVVALDLMIGYDPATLANPRVTVQKLFTGSLMTPNISTPGSIKVIMIKPNMQGVTGSGPVMAISFDLIGTNSGGINSFNAKSANAAGMEQALPTQVLSTATPSSPSASQSSDSGTSSVSQGSGATASTSTGSDSTKSPDTSVTVTSSTVAPATTLASENSRVAVNVSGMATGGPAQSAPGGADPPAQTPPATDLHEPHLPSSLPALETLPSSDPPQERAANVEAPAHQPAATMERKKVVHGSVLNSFKGFTGTRTPDALTDLFAQTTYPGVKQTPTVALSDGKQKVRIAVKSAQPADNAPNCALEGGTLVSMSKDKDTYIFEILPEQNVLEASLTVLTQREINVIPLTIAPPLAARILPQGGKLDDRTFALFLNEKNAEKNDVNGDGMKNYVDDYIITANYLAANHQSARKK